MSEMAAALLSWLLPSTTVGSGARRLGRLLPCRPRLLLACLEIYLIFSLNLVGVFAEGLPGRKTIKVSLSDNMAMAMTWGEFLHDRCVLKFHLAL